MKTFTTLAAALLTGQIGAQKVGTQAPETHPSISYSECTKSGGCTSQAGEVVLDANWRWLHKSGTTTNCYTGNDWDKTVCPDAATCSSNCAVEGGDYEGTYGIHASGNSLQLDFVTKGQYSTNIGSRNYLMESDTSYYMAKLKGREFTFDVDVSKMPCGLNGALYFVSMDKDGGMSKYSGNEAGAKYGTGYCDAQCPHDLKFINGEANCEDWKPSPTDKNAGTGKYGTCCVEMDIWEANMVSTAYTPHPCTVTGQTRCTGTQCGDNAAGDRYNGVCDKDGCDLNPFRAGVKDFFGSGSSFKIDTSKPFTVVTQFVTSDGTESGDLVEIRRQWVQDGKVFASPMSTNLAKAHNSVTEDYCTDQKTTFEDPNDFQKKGGLKAMGDAMDNGMVLVMSLWDDHDVDMLWLDSDYPTNSSTTKPGVARGTCATTSGKPDDVETNHPDASVTYSNIKFGEIGSTYPSGPTPPGPNPPSPSPAPPSPGNCPGGSLSACIALCPSNPAPAYKDCVASCVKRCS